MRKLPIKFRGKKYKNIAALAKNFGYSPDIITSRLFKGWSIARSVDTPVVRWSKKEIEVNGKSFESIAAMAKSFGFETSTIAQRLRRGWTPEEAVKKTPKVVRASRKKITITGVTFSSLGKAAKHYDIDKDRFYQRLKLGWTPKEAAGLVNRVNKHYKETSISGKTFATAGAAAKFYGIDPNVFRRRLTLDWTPEQAAGLESRTNYVKRERKETLVDGKIFPSCSAAATYYGINPNVFLSRLKCDWTPEQAVGLEPPPKKA